MTTITAKDGTQIFYKDWGSGRPVVFSHGWPLNADAWDAQMLFLAGKGFRVIAYDRRGHGRSDQPAQGNDMNTYADDLAALLDALDLRGATLVGHSMGGGEIARYIGRHGSQRVETAVLIGAVPPYMGKTPANPNGLPPEVFDGMRNGVAANRAQFYRDLAMPFFSFNRPGAKVSQGALDAFWLQGMSGGILGQYACIREFSEIDFTDDLKAMTMPTLVLHGEDDQLVSADNTSRQAVRILKNGTLKTYPGGSHGLCVVNADEVNADLLAFLTA